MTFIERLRELHEKATAGPWIAYFAESAGWKWTLQAARGWLFQASNKGTKEDATLIAFTRNALPDLIAVLDQAEEFERQPNDEYTRNLLWLALDRLNKRGE